MYPPIKFVRMFTRSAWVMFEAMAERFQVHEWVRSSRYGYDGGRARFGGIRYTRTVRYWSVQRRGDRRRAIHMYNTEPLNLERPISPEILEHEVYVGNPGNNNSSAISMWRSRSQSYLIYPDALVARKRIILDISLQFVAFHSAITVLEKKSKNPVRAGNE